MSDYKQRVITEQSELETKIKTLMLFSNSKEFDALGYEDRKLLREQLETMKRYSFILLERIRRFKF